MTDGRRGEGHHPPSDPSDPNPSAAPWGDYPARDDWAPEERPTGAVRGHRGAAEGNQREWPVPPEWETAPAPGSEPEPVTRVLPVVPSLPGPQTAALGPVEYQPGHPGVPDHQPGHTGHPQHQPGHTGHPEHAGRPSPTGLTAHSGLDGPVGPGRAERRRAAKGRGRKRRSPRTPAPASVPAQPSGPTGRPLTRVEARRAAKAAKDSPAVIASRALGELFITFGVLMLLFVTYQLWWTNIRAGMEVDKERSKIEDAWADGRRPDAFEPGQGFAIMHIPKLDVVVPVAAGIDKDKVLDRGMVGHYAEGRLKTAMPSDRTGNFAVAGHRNTHGEPFRYINRLKPGDPIVVETQDAYYTYEMASILPQTAPSNIAVIGPIPPGSGFREPGRYLTLTTCTPEFTSTYRMIVWGKMVEERPRDRGKPDALVG
ncbi:class E sortase [Streptomyces sp. NPDC020965]|uniref:class E sortase n=1 Tax=Streptomyces sp. NPDC020965 TaxID=3365105 RepID=UPI0037A21326